jgi:hypothetical protein
MRALWSQGASWRVFSGKYFDFSFLDIFKNVHFQKPNSLLGFDFSIAEIIYIWKLLKEGGRQKIIYLETT